MVAARSTFGSIIARSVGGWQHGVMIRRLLCPGPVDVDPAVALALGERISGHRTERFADLLADVRRDLVALVGGDPSRSAAVVIGGSGTAANEAVLSSALEAGGRLVVLANGEFGERLARTGRALGRAVRVLAAPWGERLPVEDLGRLLDAEAADLVAMTHHETSTGMLNPIEEVGAICRAHRAPLLVDAVSSIGADPIDFERTGATYLSGSAGKAIAGHPGLSFVVGRRAALARLARTDRGHYLDLGRHYRFAEDDGQTPSTPPAPLVQSLRRALALALAEGAGPRHRRHRALAERVRRGFAALGWPALVPADQASATLTAARLPAGLSYEALRQALDRRGFVVYGGKGPLAGTILQVANLGTVDIAVIDEFFDALGSSIEEISVSACAT